MKRITKEIVMNKNNKNEPNNNMDCNVTRHSNQDQSCGPETRNAKSLKITS